jgi:hypothetical protein
MYAEAPASAMVEAGASTYIFSHMRWREEQCRKTQNGQRVNAVNINGRVGVYRRQEQYAP